MANTQNEAKGLYSAREIARMTNDALDELLEYYEDTGNEEGVARVEAEQEARLDDAMIEDSPSLEDSGYTLGSYAS